VNPEQAGPRNTDNVVLQVAAPKPIAKPAEEKQPQYMIEIGACQHDTRDRRLTHAFGRLERGSRFDLLSKIGRRAQQKP
jgi:hypothetical protein